MAQPSRAQLLGEIERLRNQLAERDARIDSLIQSEARFRLVAESTHDLVRLHGLHGEELYASPSLRQLAGYVREEVLDTPFRLRVHPDDLELIQQTRAASLRGERRRIEYRCLRTDGSHSWLDLDTVPIQGADGQVAMILYCGRDISEPKKTREALQASESRFRALVENAFDTIAIVDANGTIVYESPNAVRALGWPTLGAGSGALRNIHPDDLPEVQLVFQELVSHPGRMVHEVQLRARRPDGEYFWLEVSACNRLDDPAVKGIVVNWRNITERKEAEEALRELYANLERRVQERTAELTAANARLNLEVAERRRAQDRIEQLQADLAHAGRLNTVGEMASGLAHELNQPLTAIATYAAAALLRLREHCDTGWTPAEALTRIGEQATRAGDVIQRLRAFVSRKPPQRLPVALDEVLHEALQLADADIRASGTRLELHASDLPLHCTADRIQIVQVLVNLVRNALEAMADIPKAARQLVLRTALEKNGIRLSVADTGSGLAPEIAERLFFPFHTSKPDGLGLGLAISRSIVEAHDGRIWAEPNRGGGTVFHFTLPAARDGAPRSHVADAEALR